MEEQHLEQTETIQEQPLVKPKRKQNLTDSQRQKKAENMRKISLARIEKHRLANEAKLEEKEDQLVEKLAKVEDKKKQVRKIKEDKLESIDTPVQKVRKAQPKKKQPKVIYETSDSEEYGNETDGSDDTEVIYVAKKPKKEKNLVKPKREIREKEEQEVLEQKPVIKFL